MERPLKLIHKVLAFPQKRLIQQVVIFVLTIIIRGKCN